MFEGPLLHVVRMGLGLTVAGLLLGLARVPALQAIAFAIILVVVCYMVGAMVLAFVEYLLKEEPEPHEPYPNIKVLDDMPVPSHLDDPDV